jgi:hypothetical protein
MKEQRGCYRWIELATAVPRGTLAQNFCGRNVSTAQKPETRHVGEGRMRSFDFAFPPSGARIAAARSSQGRAVFGRGGAHP